MASMNDVVIHDQRNGLSLPVTRSQVHQQADKQLRAFTAAANIADTPFVAVQRTGKVVFFILSWCDHPLFADRATASQPQFWGSDGYSPRFRKNRMFCTTPGQSRAYRCHFSARLGARIRGVGAALRHACPATGNQRRTVEGCRSQPVIWLIFIASNSELQRDR